MAKAKKSSETIGATKPPRVRVAIFDGTGTKDIYAAKVTIYDLTPEEVIEPIKNLLKILRDNKMRD